MNGAVAASGLGMIAQAGISAVTSTVGDIANQWIDTGSLSSVNYGHAALKGGESFAISIIGSVGGKYIDKSITHTSDKSKQCFDRFIDKAYTADLRRNVGKSASALSRQANRWFARAEYYDNIAKGVTSVFGSALSIRW